MASSKKIVALICITLISLVAIGCSDSDSPTTAVTPVDTAPPAVPASIGVDFDSDSGAATISWAANTTDTDLAGFIVSRDSYGTVEALVATPALITNFEDATPTLGISVYNVYSVDTSGNQSAVSSVELVRTATHQTHDLQLH